MAKHHPDLVFCRKQPGIAIGRLCEKCDGKCVICDSYVRPHILVHICDECNYGSFEVCFVEKIIHRSNYILHIITRDVVLFVELRVYLMLTTVVSALSRRKMYESFL